MLATIGCAESDPPSVLDAPSPSASRNGRAQLASQPRATGTTPAAILSDRAEAPALGRGARSLGIRSGATYWIADDRVAQFQERSFIVEWRPPAAPKVLVRAARPNALMQDLYVSEEWLVWSEHVDRGLGADTQIYALRANDERPTLIDDVARYGPVAAFPELVLDGSDLYWTVPSIVEGIWRGKLLHVALPAGRVEILEDGQRHLFTWPRAKSGALAYEVVQQDSSVYRVRYRTADGVTRDLDQAPASEPGIGPNYLVFKQANRYDVGSLAVRNLTSGATRELGPGEAPIASGSMITWFDVTLNEGKIARATDGCLALYTANRSGSQGYGEQAGTLVGTRLAWPYLVNNDGSVSEFVRVATLVTMPC